MIERTYHGLLRKRKQVEEILGKELPDAARILFAHGIQRWIPVPDGPDEGQVDILVAWTLANQLFFCNGQCKILFDPHTEKYKQLPFQLHGGRITRARDTYAAIDDMADKENWPANYRAVFKDMFKRMAKLEQKWNEEIEQFTPDNDLTMVPELPGHQPNPISLN